MKAHWRETPLSPPAAVNPGLNLLIQHCPLTVQGRTSLSGNVWNTGCSHKCLQLSPSHWSSCHTFTCTVCTRAGAHLETGLPSKPLCYLKPGINMLIIYMKTEEKLQSHTDAHMTFRFFHQATLFSSQTIQWWWWKTNKISSNKCAFSSRTFGIQLNHRLSVGQWAAPVKQSPLMPSLTLLCLCVILGQGPQDMWDWALMVQCSCPGNCLPINHPIQSTVSLLGAVLLLSV